jgi:ketosteroid isomerase-like protein
MKKILLLFFAACLAWAASPADEQAVRAALQEFNEAARAGNRATLERLLHPDLVYVHSNARVEDRAEALKALLESKPNFVLGDKVDVKIYGNTAVLHGQMVANLMQDGAPAKIPMDFIQVWVRNGKNWQMVARHTARLPA